MRIYNLAFSSLLLLGGAVNFQGLDLRFSEQFQVDSSEKVSFAQVQKEKDSCDDRPGCDDRRAHRGSGRTEPDPLPAQAKAEQDDEDRPGGDTRREHRGSGRTEPNILPVQDKYAHRGSGRTEPNPLPVQDKYAHRGSGRTEPDPSDTLPTTRSVG